MTCWCLLKRDFGVRLAAASKVSRIQSDFDFLPIRAAFSISSTSDGSNRQNSRARREEPLGSGGLPNLDFLLICKSFLCAQKVLALLLGLILLYAQQMTTSMSTHPQAVVPAHNSVVKDIPVNAPLRESSGPGPVENRRIVEVAFKSANAPFRESLAKPPRKPRNADRRSREFLSPAEVERLIEAAQGVGRHGHRDGTMILIAYRHALRVSELTALRWDQFDLAQAFVHVRRRKNGTASNHPLHGPELRALRRLQREYPKSAYVFTTERNGPPTDSAVRKMIARAGIAAGLEFPVHPHMLRHATGYKLANDGQDTRSIQHYLGHKNISHTVRYTELSSERFKNFWQD